MTQQINFYRYKPQQKTILAFKKIVTINLIFVGILTVISAYMLADYYFTAFKLHQLKTKQDSLNKGLQSAQRAIPTEEDKKKLELTLTNLQQAKDYRQKMYTTLTQLNYQDSVGLSAYLTSMAEASVADLWLTRFFLGNNGSAITLEGITLNGSSVLLYLQSLGKTKSFKDKTFSKIEIKADDNNNQTKFVVGS